MTLEERLLTQLDNPPTHEGPHTLTATDENGRTVEVAADQVDSIGCRIQEVRLSHAGEAPDLREWSGQVAEKVTVLGDPLKLIEIDEGQSTAVLRSSEPGKRAERILYYELLLKGEGSATLNRYQASHAPGSKREQIPFALTHEALGKLVGELTI